MSAAGGLSLRDGDRLRRCRLCRGRAIGSTRSLMLTIGSTTVAFVEAVRHRLRRGHALAFVEVMRHHLRRGYAIGSTLSPHSETIRSTTAAFVEAVRHHLRRGHALAFVEVVRRRLRRGHAIGLALFASC